MRDAATSHRSLSADGKPVLYGDLRSWALIAGDSLELMASLPEGSVDVVITDPPYGLSFKDEAWDGDEIAEPEGFQLFSAEWAWQAKRALRPGAHLVSFGSPRTFHRLVAGAEDAGLEVRDMLVWLHAAGVPKSRRMEGGRGTALKPAYEPILLARAPLPSGKSVATNVAVRGTGALNIDATRPPRPEGAGRATDEGYWPSHLLLSHNKECGDSNGGCSADCVVPFVDRVAPPDRLGGLSRMFYAAKADRAEREAGCDGLAVSRESIFSSRRGLARPRANQHPTVKPIELMRWLVRLVAPPGGVVLDPFAGSGSTGCAAMVEGRQFIGIEREKRYVPIARARLEHWAGVARARRSSSRQLPAGKSG